MSSRYTKLGLQASSADRWLACTASPHEIVRRAPEIPESEPKQYAIDGDEAHKLAELFLRKLPDPEGKFEELYGHEVSNEMRAAAGDYAKFVRDFVTDGAALFVEVSAPLPYMPDRVCRLDALVVDSNSVVVADFKYGVGVSVEAEGNPQLIINGMAAIQHLESLDVLAPTDDLIVKLRIYQPRARDKRIIREWDVSYAELRKYYEAVEHTAKGIIENSPALTFAPSDDTCRFCPLNQPDAGITCAHRTGKMFADLPEAVKAGAPVLNLPDPANISVETLGQLVLAAPTIKSFFDACRDRAYGLVEGGTSVPGLKMVAGKRSRSWADDARAKDLLAQKLKVDDYAPRELVSPAAAEKLLKGVELSTKYKNLLNAQIVTKEGKPTLVSEDDERPALQFKISAASEFAAIDNAPEAQPAPAVSGDSVLD